jgi:hypothetical protein
MKREARGQGEFSVGRIFWRSHVPYFRSAGFLGEFSNLMSNRMSRHNQQRSLLKKASSSWEAPMR